MANVNWTSAQKNAIEAFGGDILVSAAAGSGKTAVLSQRVIHHITNSEVSVDADQLLIVTFSNAAASEMKQRISKKLWELAAVNPNDTNIQRQLLLIDTAQISTIHSFCIQLLRANFHQLNISADFKIADEKELEILKRSIIKDVITARYNNPNESFYDMVELLSTSKDDKKLESTILKLYEFLRNYPFYNEWLDNVLLNYADNTQLEDSTWYKIILDYTNDAIDYTLQIVKSLVEDIQCDDQLLNAYGPAINDDFAQINRMRDMLSSGAFDWDALYTAVNSIKFATLGRLVGYDDEEKKSSIQNRRKDVKSIIEGLQKNIFTLSSEQYKQDNSRLYPIVKELFDITMEFDRQLAQVKLQKNILDFGDLEHFTLELLYETVNGQHQVSSIAKELQNSYYEILIDEYQDTNGTQEMIFAALSTPQGNRFLVGDVKQSIYRFRQARPENFLEKKEHFALYDGFHYPAKIILSENFRTRNETTGLINFIFKSIFSKKIGEMEYEQEDALNSSGSFDYNTAITPELMVVDADLIGDNEAEAKLVAQKIRTMLDDQVMVEDKEGKRPVQLSDICILLRSRTKASLYAQELNKLGIRAWSDKQEGFIGTTEVAPIISYLKIIENPLLDLDLAQVLGSYLYGFSTQKLAELRLKKGETLFAALLSKAANDIDAKKFLDDYNLLRREAITRCSTEVLQLIYSLTSAENKVFVMPMGNIRLANLRLLSSYAGNYNTGADIGDFVSYLYTLEECECDLPSAMLSAGNAVSIMSIHKSKGLEFPVVFLCETTSKFNMLDLVSNTLLHPELGFSCVMRDNRTMRQHKTIPFIAMNLENKRALISEELRVLYVAMTRARERLIITATDKKMAKLLKAVNSPYKDGKASHWSVRTANCYFDWISLALVHHPEFPNELLELPLTEKENQTGIGRLSVTAPVAIDIPVNDVTQTAENNIDVQETTQESQSMLVLDWQYSFVSDTLTPVKTSVSKLSKGAPQKEYFFTRRPKLLTKKKLTPAEKGIAAHKFMQFAHFSHVQENIDEEILRLTDKQFLSEEEGDFIDVNMLTTFFDSDIGRRVLKAKQLYREIRFMQEFTPDELEKINSDYKVSGKTVVQGVADCVLVENGKGILIDYKTDFVKKPEELILRYKGQLDLYRIILENQLKITISEKIIYSFALGKAIYVD